VRVITQLFSVVVYSVRAAHTFTLGLLKREHLTNGDQWKSHTVTQNRAFRMICMYPPPGMSSRLLWASNSSYAVQRHSHE